MTIRILAVNLSIGWYSQLKWNLPLETRLVLDGLVTSLLRHQLSSFAELSSKNHYISAQYSDRLPYYWSWSTLYPNSSAVHTLPVSPPSLASCNLQKNPRHHGLMQEHYYAYDQHSHTSLFSCHRNSSFLYVILPLISDSQRIGRMKAMIIQHLLHGMGTSPLFDFCPSAEYQYLVKRIVLFHGIMKTAN